MIITRTPFRVTLGGGGTDLPGYYESYGGFVVSAAITKYMYIMVNRRFESTSRISYSKTEIVGSVEEIQHPIVREALRLLKIVTSIEIISMADLPAESGLGSSGSFTVGLLAALHAFKGEWRSPQELAEEAFTIEAEILGEPVGKQDQYIAAYGGIISLDIGRDGRVLVEKVALGDDTLDQLESNSMYFYTGKHRKSSEILKSQSQSMRANEEKVVESMHLIRAIGVETKDRLVAGEVDWFGRSLDRHWQLKKKISDKMSDSAVDEWYQTAKNNGAMGGKLIGAGGGGFLMVYCPRNEDRTRIRRALAQMSLREIRFRFDLEGSKTLANFS